jgi:O-antigen ligase
VGRRSAPAIDILVIAMLALYVILFLAVRRATNACFFGLVLLSLLYLVQQRAAFAEAWRIDGSRLMVAALAALFVGAVAAKLVRGEFDYLDLNSPARFLLASLLLLYFTAKRIRFVGVFAAVVPLATPAVLLAAFLSPRSPFSSDGRLTTSFVDYNTLGSYAVILSFMSLLTLDALGRRSPWQRTLVFAGVACGLVVTVLASSRSGWIAILPLAALWVLLRWRRGWTPIVWQGLALLAIGGLVAIMLPNVSDRLLIVIDEVRSWIDGSNPLTSVGDRLTMWMMSIDLYGARPLAGYGWPGVQAELIRPEYALAVSPRVVHLLAYSGPHSDLLMMALSHGVFGIAAYAALLFVPASFFWRRLARSTGESRLACELGLCLVVGVFFCGLFNEMLSLKYLVSFYGLTVAGLAAQVLGDSAAAGKAA